MPRNRRELMYVKTLFNLETFDRTVACIGSVPTLQPSSAIVSTVTLQCTGTSGSTGSRSTFKIYRLQVSMKPLVYTRSYGARLPLYRLANRGNN